MTFNFTIHRPDGSPMTIDLETGQRIFVLGANGAGKSSLMQRIYTTHHSSARRISAHRQTWFSSSSVTLSPEQKRSTEVHLSNVDISTESRWKDDYAAQRANIAIYDLIDAENVRARTVAEAVDADDIDLAKALSKKDAPIKVINELLRLSSVPIEISVKQSEQVVARKSGGPTYSVAELSDGERNALLIAANVLTVASGALLLIDEPERHLHRSIISPLLTLLFKRRPDCAFVVSTHDVTLPLDNPSARTILVRSCTYAGSAVTSWDADIVPAESEIDEATKKDILGSRRTLVFVEGDTRSLDQSLYNIAFPNVTIIGKHSCRDVDNAVSGIKGAAELHWVRAFGIIDDDRRTPDDVARLESKGIYAVPVYSVESIYYHPEIQSRVAARHASVTGANCDALLLAARKAAIDAIRPHMQRLSERAIEKTLRDELDKHWPKQADISAGKPISIAIDVAAAVNAELEVFKELILQEDLTRIVSRYPVRETPALRDIALKLGFQSRDQYENAVRRLLMDDPEALEFVRSLFRTLSVALAGA